MSIVYLNKNFLPSDEAKISVLDRGFLFADGVYEVIPIYRGKLFQLKEHIDRLQNSLAAIKLSVSITHEQWQEIIAELLQRNKIKTQTKELYLQITRGAAKTRTHAFPNPPIPPTILAMLIELKQPTYEDLCEGIYAKTHEDIRWQYCHIKSISLLPNILLTQEAWLEGAKEVILIRNNLAIEGCQSNIFIVKNHKIITPPKSNYLLIGTTRELILELLKQYSIPHEERNITKEELINADEIWITSATLDITPVTKLDAKIIGNGHAGPMWKKVITYFQNHKDSL